MRTILLNGTLIDGTGAAAVPQSSIVVEGDTIQQIEAAETRGDTQAMLDGQSQSSDHVIDCSGLFVLPGLIDAHVHVGAVTYNIEAQHHLYPLSLIAIRMGQRLERMLNCGYTTVRDAGGADAGFKIALDDGDVVGPRLLVSGRPLSQTGGHGDHRTLAELSPITTAPFGMSSVIVDGVAAAAQAAREEIRRGADWIKVFASGGAISPTDRLTSAQFSVAELTAICQAAASAGVSVMAHALTPDSIQQCATAGVRTIEHGNMLDRGTAKVMHDAGMYLVPTMLAYQYSYENADRFGRSALIKAKLKQGGELSKQALEIACEENLKIGLGSDLLGESLELMGQEIALQATVQGSIEAIKSATLVNAELLGLSDKIGSLAAGKIADLIVVDRDPVAEPGVLGDKEHVRLVMQSGEIRRNLLHDPDLRKELTTA
jgi:imidazolonepropionase-like amidohydrolase